MYNLIMIKTTAK